jgi:hypothetical protein
LDADGRWQSREHSINETPKARILILGGGFADLHLAIHVDTKTDDSGGFCCSTIMALISGNIKGC